MIALDDTITKTNSLLSVRVLNVLEHENILTLRDLKAVPMTQIPKWRWIGKKGFYEILSFLEKQDIVPKGKCPYCGR